jgi:hypothetical protein
VQVPAEVLLEKGDVASLIWKQIFSPLGFPKNGLRSKILCKLREFDADATDPLTRSLRSVPVLRECGGGTSPWA